MLYKDILKDKFNELKKKKKCGLISFITAGDPDFNTSYQILNKLPECGVDIIELGMPFSDPMADGPIIQKANDRAIKNNMNLNRTFELVKKFRKKNHKTPLILMGYYNPVHRFGINNFISHVKKNNINGVIIVDLPPEEDSELCLPMIKNKIHFIKLATPTTDKKRFNKIIKNSSGFIYFISITGITGASYKSNLKLNIQIKNLKKMTKLPIAVGFGIKNKHDVKNISKKADAVVVGSSIIKKVEEAQKNKYNKKKLIANIVEYVKELSSVL